MGLESNKKSENPISMHYTYYNKMKKDIIQKKGYILELASAANASALFKTENHLLQHSKIASRPFAIISGKGYNMAGMGY